MVSVGLIKLHRHARHNICVYFFRPHHHLRDTSYTDTLTSPNDFTSGKLSSAITSVVITWTKANISMGNSRLSFATANKRDFLESLRAEESKIMSFQRCHLLQLNFLPSDRFSFIFFSVSTYGVTYCSKYVS